MSDSDQPVSEIVMDLIFAAASLMCAVAGRGGDLCPPMTRNDNYNAAAQAVADLADSFLGREPEKPA